MACKLFVERLGVTNKESSERTIRVLSRDAAANVVGGSCRANYATFRPTTFEQRQVNPMSPFEKEI
ncbi:hypothetical protein GCM10009114_13380 [Aliiglaciecola litoralis]|uniref:Uncharacterized protein n=1 Tax=Aliiglaciecola litoralis TaxID=582857 RepID=A0ABN1LF66_9ALTE